MEKEIKNQKVIIIIISIIIVIVTAVCIYLMFIKSIDNNDMYSKIDDTKGIYYVITGKTYDIYSNNYESNKKTIDSEKIVLNYPVININTNSVLNVNTKIKEIFNNIENGFKSKKEDDCICVKVNDYYHCEAHIMQPGFKVYEDDKFITILIRTNFLTHCASGYSTDTIYTVSKESGKEFTNFDIIKYFGYNRDTINKELAKYIQSLYEADISFELEGIPNYLSLAIYNGKLIVGYDLIDGTYYYSYDGNSFKEENIFGVF